MAPLLASCRPSWTPKITSFVRRPLFRRFEHAASRWSKLPLGAGPSATPTTKSSELHRDSGVGIAVGFVVIIARTGFLTVAASPSDAERTKRLFETIGPGSIRLPIEKGSEL